MGQVRETGNKWQSRPRPAMCSSTISTSRRRRHGLRSRHREGPVHAGRSRSPSSIAGPMLSPRVRHVEDRPSPHGHVTGMIDRGQPPAEMIGNAVQRSPPCGRPGDDGEQPWRTRSCIAFLAARRSSTRQRWRLSMPSGLPPANVHAAAGAALRRDRRVQLPGAGDASGHQPDPHQRHGRRPSSFCHQNVEFRDLRRS